ncbi:MAG: hypothetical protein Q9M94_04380 [Candidatus Gracilibacteria bacterium]|nr:hypothetical protein [Candidatus Gracilibacteria bacterium]
MIGNNKRGSFEFNEIESNINEDNNYMHSEIIKEKSKGKKFNIIILIILVLFIFVLGLLYIQSLKNISDFKNSPYGKIEQLDIEIKSLTKIKEEKEIIVSDLSNLLDKETNDLSSTKDRLIEIKKEKVNILNTEIVK